MRSAWSPHKAKTVVLECGHIELDWPMVKMLGSMVKDAYCETCTAWIPIWRDATMTERVVGLSEPQTLPVDPPF